MYDGQRGSRILIFTAILIRFFFVGQNGDWIKHSMAPKFILCWNITQGVVYLFYPLFGWISGIYSAHYKMMKTAFILTIISSVLMLATSIERIQFASHENEPVLSMVRLVISIVLLIMALSGLGIYEANVIQFGMRQLFEAPADQLSAFVHWYYWGLNVGPLIGYYAVTPIISYFQNCVFTMPELQTYNKHVNVQLFGWITLPTSILQLVAGIIGYCLIHRSKRHLEDDFQRINPFKTMAKVLKYCFRQKQPEQRSAFTFWENSIPHRIDYGKSKYGGPFTHEQVEDTKTFLRLLCLILSLFGFFLQTDAQTATEIVMKNTGCPSKPLLLVFYINSSHLTLLVILITIPVYQLIVKRYILRYLPKMLTRIGIGMFLCLLQELFVSIAFGYFMQEGDKQAISCALKRTEVYMHSKPSIITMCVVSTTKFLAAATDIAGNDQGHSCSYVCPGVVSGSYMLSLLFVLQVIRGVTSILVFLSVLEFICAQAPHTMKGLLIGIWYGMLSIQYIVMGILNMSMVEKGTGSVSSDVNQWTLYAGTRGFCIFISLALYSIVCKYYRYRERNEVVDHRLIIERQYERELLYKSNSQ